MTNKTYRFAAVAAVLLALLVFAAPVGAAGDATSENYVAKIGGEYYSSLTYAINNASDNAIIYLNATVIEETVSPWNQIADHSCEKNITIYGVNYNKNPSDWGEHQTILTGGMYLGYDDSKTRDHTITVKGISFQGGGLTIADQKVVIIENNTFTNIVSAPGAICVLDQNKNGISGSATICNNVVDITSGSGIRVRNGGDVTITNNSVTKTQDNSILLEETAKGNVLISGNTLSDWAFQNSAGRAIRIVKDADGEFTINNNVLTHSSGAPEEFIKITGGTSAPSVSGNTLNGATTSNIYTSGTTYYIDLVAQIDNVCYSTFAAAVAEAGSGDTITLLKDVALTENLDIGKSITIDGNGKTITGAYQKQLRLWGASSPIDVTLKKINIDGTGSYAVLVGTPSILVVESATLTGWNAVYVVQESTTWPEAKGDGSTVTIKNSVLSGTNSGSEGFGTVAIFANSTAVTISGSTLTAEVTGSGIQSIIRYGGMNDPVHGDSAVTITDSTLNVLNSGTGTASIYSNGTAETGTLKLTLGEGVTANVNPSAYIASGMEVVQPGDKYLVQKYVDRSSSSSSSSTTKPEEPEQPEEPVVEPETPTEEPVAGEPTVETEVTDGGEVTFDTPAEPENPDAGEPGDAPADAPAEPAVTGVVLPEGTDSKVAFIPVSEKPAPAGKEENTKKVFEINVPKYEKGKPATVKFTMTVAELEKDGKTAADVALWHHDEETGEWTKLVTTFVIKDGIVYFEAITFDFSPFAIVYEDTELPTDEPETPEQPTESPAPVLAVLAALGAAVVLRRK